MPKFRDKERNTDNQKTWYEVTSDNIFEDLGHPEEEAGNLLMRSDLMIEIASIIQDQGLSQAEAAKVLGVKQPRISELITGRISKFKVDVLIKYVNRLGKKVRLVFEDTNKVA